MSQLYTVERLPLLSLLVALSVIAFVQRAVGQDLADGFNRANSNTVGGGWAETENAAGQIRVNANELQLRNNANVNVREYVSRTTPGSYSTTLNTNNCTLTWAFNMRQTRPDPSGFNTGNYGAAIVLAGSDANLTLGNGYAVVLGQAGATDALRLVSYSGGLDLNGNLTDIISTGDFELEYLDVRVTYVPSSDTWSLFYTNNGTAGAWGPPLSASTSGGSQVNATWTGTPLPIIGCLWNHNTANEQLRVDNFYVPSGRPTVPVITPSSATICNGGSVVLGAAATSSSTTRVTFNSTGGPATVTGVGANDASLYPWTITTSGLPASGVTVESVTLNGVTHTFPDDLDVLLQSPTGTNVILMADVGGGGNITALNYTFQDDSPALSDGGTNPSGLYEPTNPDVTDDFPTSPGPGNGFSQANPTLAFFTGDFNGAWDLLIRDDADLDDGQIASWSITFTYTSTVSYTWSPATGLSGTTGSSVTASPTSSQVYTVTAAHTGNACTSSQTVAVTVVDPPTTANAGPDQTVCSNSVTLAANAPSVGAGAWTIRSPLGGGGGSFGDNTSPTSSFTGVAGTTYTLRWTISNTPCTASFDEVVITLVANPTTATVGGAQTICENGTTAGLGGNTPVVGTGAWSIIGGGTGNFTPNAGNPSATFTHTGGTVTALRWTISNAPCTPSSADVSITITQPSVASNAGTDFTVCSQPGTATLDGNTPTNGGSGTWTQESGPATATITTPGSPTSGITDLTVPGSYVFRWTITSAAPCGSTQDEVTITVGVCVYYSQMDGNVSDPIWSDQPVGTPGAATFNSAVSMVVQSDLVTNTTNTQVNDLTVEAGGELELIGGTSFTASGDAVTVNGTLDAQNNSLLVLNSPVASTFTLTGTQSVFDLSVDADVSCTVTGGLFIRGSLDLFDGIFDASGASVTLRSFANSTGRLGPVDPSASYLGNLRVERYIPAGATNWRLLGSPVAGNLVYHWQDDFITAGYPGSQYPWFDDPVGSGILWPSIRHYDEPNPGPLPNDGVIGVTNSSQSLAAGKGFAVWCGDMLGGTAPFTIDLTGTPNIALSPISLPMSWTNTGVPGTDGWNLVSNPVPSPIAFDQISRGANVEDYVSYYDPATGNVATWDISLGSGTNGGTNTIQSSQGFWLKANGSSVTTTVSESDKIVGNTGGFFGGDEETTLELLRLRITSGMNTYSDETVVVFSVGAPEVESEDVRKMIFSLPAAPQIGTFGSPTELLAINAYGSYTTAISIPVMVDAGVSGTYTVTATGYANMGLRCLTLEDLLTGEITPLGEGTAYSFEMDAEADASVPRLILHATAPLSFESIDATCGGMANGQATVVITEGPADVTWTDEFGAVLSQQTGVMEGDVTFGGLAAGSYMVHVTSNTACGELVSDFTIDAPFVLDGTTVSNSATTCADAEDGSIDMMVMGGVEPYTYAWSNGADTEDLIAGAGSYTLTVTDANNCEWASDVVTIDAGGAVAGFTVVDPVVLVNTEVIFTNTSVSGETFFWEFGDGATSTEVEPVHAYALPGTYTVTLTVTSGDCSDVTSFDVTVELNTGISTSTAVELSAWVSANGFVVEHGFTSGIVYIEVLDATGRLHATRNVGASPGRVILPHEGLSTGIWFVRVTNGDKQQTFRLPLLR